MLSFTDFRLFWCSHLYTKLPHNCCTIFPKFYPVTFSWRTIYVFPTIFIYKRFNFWYSFWMFANFFMTWCSCCGVGKAFIIIFIGRICGSFFVFSPNQDNLFMIHRSSDLSDDIWNVINEYNKDKSIPFTDSSKPIWYLERSDLFLHL